MDITWLLGEVTSRHVPICVIFTVTWHKPFYKVSCVQISHSREELKEKEPESKHSLSLNTAPSVLCSGWDPTLSFRTKRRSYLLSHL